MRTKRSTSPPPFAACWPRCFADRIGRLLTIDGATPARACPPPISSSASPNAGFWAPTMAPFGPSTCSASSARSSSASTAGRPEPSATASQDSSSTRSNPADHLSRHRARGGLRVAYRSSFLFRYITASTSLARPLLPLAGGHSPAVLPNCRDGQDMHEKSIFVTHLAACASGCSVDSGTFFSP